MKTIVIAGGSSGAGKTTLANELLGILPGSVHVKIGHHAPKPEKKNMYFRTGTPFPAIAARAGRYRFAMVESNAILREITPECTIYLPSDKPKSSSALAESMADIIRGNRLTPAVVAGLARKLEMGESRVRRISWLAGARPSAATAVILAGGKSSRMGSDKAALTIEGQPIIDRIIDQLSPWFDKIIVSTGDGAFRRRGVRTAADIHPGKGPLAGIEAALRASTTEHNFVVACDIPFLNIPLIFRLLSELEESDISVPSFEQGRHEPLYAGYRKRVGAVAGALIRRNRLRVSALFEECNVSVVRPDDRAWYVNMNTPEDYHRCLRASTRRPSKRAVSRQAAE